MFSIQETKNQTLKSDSASKTISNNCAYELEIQKSLNANAIQQRRNPTSTKTAANSDTFKRAG